MPTDDSPASTALAAPSISITSVKFSNGEVIQLEPNDIVVFVGPNNAGKTRALRDIETLLSGQQSQDGQVIVDVQYSPSDHDADAVLATIQENSRTRRQQFYSPVLQGFGYNIQSDYVQHRWPSQLTELVGYFVRRIDTDSRLSGSNEAPQFAARTDPATHPIHLLYNSSSLEEEVSNRFHTAFGEDLVVDRKGGRVLPLRVGARPDLAPGEQSHQDSYDERFIDSTKELQEQGDGMRAFATMLLNLFATKTASVFLLDEPEAFLHPPQARYIGRLIARSAPSYNQQFVATHSSHVLEGLLDADETTRLRVIRIDRHGSSNTPHELNKEVARELTDDPLLRQSSAISGVFHRRVIICEGVADCMFYRAILDLHEIRGKTEPDVLFLSANGKQRLHSLAASMVGLGVPTDVIADIDILDNQEIAKRTYESLGGKWDSVAPHFVAIQKAINRRDQPLSVEQMQAKVREIAERSPDDFANTKSMKRKIENAFKEVSPWGRIQEGGETAIPREAQLAYSKLRASLESVGLWLVPEGELEGFYRNCTEEGPAWVQGVLSRDHWQRDPDLGRAKAFMSTIWRSRD